MIGQSKYQRKVEARRKRARALGFADLPWPLIKAYESAAEDRIQILNGSETPAFPTRIGVVGSVDPVKGQTGVKP